jgi:hypothetical protein
VNSPRWWSKHLENLLQTALGAEYYRWCIPYVDDILIYGEIIEQCSLRFEYVKQLLLLAGKKISHEQAPGSAVNICGMEFSAFGWRMNEDSRAMLVKTLENVPRTVK